MENTPAPALLPRGLPWASAGIRGGCHAPHPAWRALQVPAAAPAWAVHRFLIDCLFVEVTAGANVSVIIKLFHSEKRKLQSLPVYFFEVTDFFHQASSAWGIYSYEKLKRITDCRSLQPASNFHFCSTEQGQKLSYCSESEMRDTQTTTTKKTTEGEKNPKAPNPAADLWPSLHYKIANQTPAPPSYNQTKTGHWLETAAN